MTHITFADKRIELDEGQTVLSALLDHGYDIPNSCRAGVCQSCMMQAVEGEVPDKSQKGLKETLKAQGFFLACSCEPSTPLNIVSSNSADLRSQASVVEHQIIGTDILRLRVKPEQNFNYHAGQYITIWKNDTTGRSYSLASVAELDDFLELHIRRIQDGVVSNWLHTEIKAGDSLQIQDAIGDCFYIPGSPEQKLILAGTGTGLAPLIGITRDALQQGHRGEIHLIHGAKQFDDLYMHRQLIDMSEQIPNFHYRASVLQADEVISPVRTESIDKLMMAVVTDPAQWNAYLCGDPDIVNTLKKKLFVAGASMKNIYTDPFIIGAD